MAEKLTLADTATLAVQRLYPAMLDYWKDLPAGYNPVAIAVAEMHRRYRWFTVGLIGIGILLTSLWVLVAEWLEQGALHFSTNVGVRFTVAFAVISAVAVFIAGVARRHPSDPQARARLDSVVRYVGAVNDLLDTTGWDILELPADRAILMRDAQLALVGQGAQIVALEIAASQLVGAAKVVKLNEIGALKREVADRLRRFSSLEFNGDGDGDVDYYVAMGRRLLVSSLAVRPATEPPAEARERSAG